MMMKIIEIVLFIVLLSKTLPIVFDWLSIWELKRYKKKKIKFDKKKMPRVKLDIYFGLPGSGKSSYLTYLAKIYGKLGVDIYTNCMDIDFSLIPNIHYIPYSYIGNVDVDNSILLLDEMGLELDAREFKTNFKDKQVLKWWKLFRHHNCPIFLFSQTTDIDKKLRDLAQNYYLVRQSIPYVTSILPIIKKVGIDEQSKQLIDAYSFPKFFDKVFNKKKRAKRIFQPFVWKYFNSWGCDKLPSVDEYEKANKLQLAKLNINRKVI